MDYLDTVKERILKRREKRNGIQYALQGCLLKLYSATEREEKVSIEKAKDLLQDEFGPIHLPITPIRIPFGSYHILSTNNYETIRVRNKHDEGILTVTRSATLLNRQLDRLFREDCVLFMDLYHALVENYEVVEAELVQAYTKQNQHIKQYIDSLFDK